MVPPPFKPKVWQLVAWHIMRMAIWANWTNLDPSRSRSTALALRRPGATLSDLADSLDRIVEELDKPAKHLSEMGLLRVDETEHVSAVSPMLAEAIVLGAEDLELGRAARVRRGAAQRDPPAGRRLE